MGAHSAWVARQLNNDKGEWRGSGWRPVDLDSERGRLVRELAEVDLRLSGGTAKEADSKRREELLRALAPAENEPEQKRTITWLDEEEEEGMAGLTDEQKRQKVVDFVAANKGVPRRSVIAHLGKGANYSKHKDLLAQMVEEGVIECHQSDGVMRMWIPGYVVSSVAPEHEHAEVRQAVVTQTATSTTELVDDDIAVMLVREREATKRAEHEREELQHERDQLAKTVERFELNAATIIATITAELAAVKAERDRLQGFDALSDHYHEELQAVEAELRCAQSEIFDLKGEIEDLEAERSELLQRLAKLDREERALEMARETIDRAAADLLNGFSAWREQTVKRWIAL